MNESKTPKAGGLWGRMFGMQADTPQEATPAAVPVAEEAGLAEPALAEPVVVEEALVVEELAIEGVPEAESNHADATVVEAEAVEIVAPLEELVTDGSPVEVFPAEVPVAAPIALAAEPNVPILQAMPVAPAAPPVAEPAPAALAPCAACGATRKPGQTYCDDCGYLFPNDGKIAMAAPSANPSPAVSSPLPSASRAVAMPQATPTRIRNNRFELGGMIAPERNGIRRHRGFDHASGKPVPVVIAAANVLPVTEVEEPIAVAEAVDDDIVPSFDFDMPGTAPVAQAVLAGEAGAAWPSLAWERQLLEKSRNPALPTVVDSFIENDVEYLVESAPAGRNIWDAWDDIDSTSNDRYTWLQQICLGLDAVHQGGAIFDGLTPDMLAVTDAGQAYIADLSGLLPLPVPSGVQIPASLYTAPELILSPHTADARADMYSFGAILYSLEYLHHPLEEKDFERQFQPRQITDRFPDVHPLFLRLINKTFVREIFTRFPTDEGTKTDPTGFKELHYTLGVCRKAFDTVRLDIACWTTTGMIRTGNEDAFTVLHGVDSRQDELVEYAMVLLADGMGGYDAGEVAAAMAMNELRKYFLQQPMFAGLTGGTPPEKVDPQAYMKTIDAALRHANKEVFTASRTPGKGKRGMGCTAQAVYVDNRHVIVGHVGDSRTYHIHRGRLIQLTRDQTLVNRLVELRQLTEAEAENHPRKNELQQAIGGQPDVVPGVHHGALQRGDWVLVCSDGLTNHISNKELEQMLTRETSNSAEEAARRLLNLCNLRGATDNATIVVIRAS
jgi:serine/threonine protein phosphatase PrpC